MNCTSAQDAILDALTARTADSAEVAAHLATCSDCAIFAARQQALDARLAAVLIAPSLTASFRATLATRLRAERRRVWLDVAPDVVHFASCAVATAACAALAPANITAIVGIGATAASVAYVALATLRTSLDDAD